MTLAALRGSTFDGAWEVDWLMVGLLIALLALLHALTLGIVTAKTASC